MRTKQHTARYRALVADLKVGQAAQHTESAAVDIWMKIEKKREREKRQLMNETMKVRIEFIFQLCSSDNITQRQQTLV